MAATRVSLPAAVPTQPAWHFETLRCQLPCVMDGLGVGGERPSAAFAFISKHHEGFSAHSLELFFLICLRLRVYQCFRHLSVQNTDIKKGLTTDSLR